MVPITAEVSGGSCCSIWLFSVVIETTQDGEQSPDCRSVKEALQCLHTALFEALCSEVVKQGIYRTGVIMEGWKSVTAEMNEWLVSRS